MDTDKFHSKYRIPSARWAAWDYSSNAAYFITICTANRTHDFGEIKNGVMTLTSLGQAAVDCWNEIPAHFPFVETDASIVMPNHVHGIVVINKTAPSRTVETQDVASVETQDVASVETQDVASLRGNKFGPQSQNLASIVRGYKIGVTKFARENNIAFTWQARYHDRVIRNAGEHERIAHYILANPQKWTEDELYAA